MLSRFHLAENRGNFSLGINDKGGAFGSHVFLTIHRLFHPDAVRRDNRFVWIGQQGEGKIELGNKFLMGFHRISAHAKEGSTAIL